MVEVVERLSLIHILQRKCREQIMTSSKYLVSIVNDILDMNKLESGGVVEQEIPVSYTHLTFPVLR